MKRVNADDSFLHVEPADDLIGLMHIHDEILYRVKFTGALKRLKVVVQIVFVLPGSTLLFASKFSPNLATGIHQFINDKKLEEENYKNNRERKSKKDSPELFILKHFYWALLKNKDDINYSWNRKYYRFLGQYLDTYDCEKIFLDLDPNFRKLRDLKEIYIRFNKSHQDDPKGAEAELETIIKLYESSDFRMFHEFAELLKTHKKAIVILFTYINVEDRKNQNNMLCRLSNGPMEGFNNNPKDYKRNANGVANFDFTRNRILWALRTDARPLAVPRKLIRHEVPESHKRGPYNKKKQ